jgi:hypothetical protein
MNMGTQCAIIEGLRMKRNTTVNENAKIGRRPRIAYRVVTEKKLVSFDADKKQSRHAVANRKNCQKKICEKRSDYAAKSMEEMPKGKLEETIIIIYSNGDRYVGEVRDGLPDGEGTVVSSNGDMFAGEWRNGTPHGRGHLLWANGEVYVGTWKNGNKHGKGAYCIDDEVYEVEYDNGTLLNTKGSINDKASRRK